MEEDTFKQLEEQFGSDWSCSCGGSFEAAWVEVVSRTKNSFLARYSCQICGREQMFTGSTGLKKEIGKEPMIEVPNGTITSDDVLDIKEELTEISSLQIKGLAKKKKFIQSPITKIARR